MNKTALALATALSLSLTAGALSANENKQNMEGTGSEERNAGTVPPAQGTSSMPAALADEGANFGDLDQNQDGELEEDELNAYGATAAGMSPTTSGSPGHQDMSQYDQDESGTIDEDEWLEYEDDLEEGDVEVD